MAKIGYFIPAELVGKLCGTLIGARIAMNHPLCGFEHEIASVSEMIGALEHLEVYHGDKSNG